MSHIILSPGLTITAGCLFIPACSLMVGLRFYTRHVQKARLEVDDWLVIPALVLVLGMQVTMIIEFSKKLIGYPDPHFDPGHPDARSNLPFYPIELMQIPALGLTKLSFIFLFRRIFLTGGNLFRWFSYFSLWLIGLVTLWITGFFFAWIFICGSHPDHYWKSATIEKKTCVNTPHLHNAFSISDVILDVIILVMCLPMIWRLHMTTSRKLAVTGVFSFGLITVAASVTRMVIFIQSTAVRYAPDIDFEYLVTDGIYWSMLETGLGLITANLVVVYGLFAKRSFHGLLTSARRLFSLPSLSSLGSRKSASQVHQEDHEYKGDDDTSERKALWYSMSSIPAGSQVESSAQYADNNEAERGNLQTGQIRISNTLRQQEERI